MTYFGDIGHQRKRIRPGVFRDKLGWLYDDIDEPLYACRSCGTVGSGLGVTFISSTTAFMDASEGDRYECLTCGVEADSMEPETIEKRARA